MQRMHSLCRALNEGASEEASGGAVHVATVLEQAAPGVVQQHFYNFGPFSSFFQAHRTVPPDADLAKVLKAESKRLAAILKHLHPHLEALCADALQAAYEQVRLLPGRVQHVDCETTRCAARMQPGWHAAWPLAPGCQGPVLTSASPSRAGTYIHVAFRFDRLH